MTLLARYRLVVSGTKKRIGRMLTPPSGSPGCQVLCVIAEIVLLRMSDVTTEGGMPRRGVTYP